MILGFKNDFTIPIPIVPTEDYLKIINITIITIILYPIPVPIIITINYYINPCYSDTSYSDLPEHGWKRTGASTIDILVFFYFAALFSGPLGSINAAILTFLWPISIFLLLVFLFCLCSLFQTIYKFKYILKINIYINYYI